MPDQTDVTGRRIGAALLDLVGLLALLIAVGLVFGKGHSSGGNASVNLTGTSALVFFVLAFVYYWIPEALTGQTLGKRLLSIRVRRADGAVPGLGSAAVRTLLRVVDGFAFYLVGLVTILATKSNQRIGDLAARTFVGPA
jgi:uncharacterized RDD family membrane protein YckC